MVRALVLFAFLAPLLVALLGYARALRPLRRGGSPAFFGFAQQSSWNALLAFVAWIPTALRWLMPALMAQHLPLGLRGPCAGLLLLGPPVLTMCVLGLLVHDVARRAGLTEWGWRDAVGDALLLLVGTLVPTVLLMSAMDAVRGTLLREATLAAIAAIAMAIAAGGVRRRRSGLTPHAISSGELRDRVFGLAQRAGVKLQQLYVVPFRRFRMANAFAVQGNIVTLTDLLLRELDRDEVDGVLAHEMAHLARRDPDKLAWSLLGTVALPMAIGMIGGYGTAALLVALCLPLQLAIQRRMEYATDARALTLGIRPEALISGLARLHRLARVPARWSLLHEVFITHPSLERRARRIGERAGLDPQVVAALLDAPQEAGPHYTVPASIEAPRAFGSTFRRSVLSRLSWLLMATAALVPALVVAALGPLGPVPRLAGIALAAVAGLAGWLAAWAFDVAGSTLTLERTIASRLGVKDAPDGQRHFAGLALGPSPRVYEGFSMWDAGFLTVHPGRLDYLGEEASFSLAVDQVRDIWVDPGLPGWIRIPMVRVSWQRADGTSGALGLLPLGAGNAFTTRAATRKLHAALAAWRAAPRDARQGDGLGPPPTMEVTSASPSEGLKPRFILTMLIVLGVLSLGAAFLIGLPLHPMVRGWVDASAATSIVYLLAVAPLLAWREPKSAEGSAEERRRAA